MVTARDGRRPSGSAQGSGRVGDRSSCRTGSTSTTWAVGLTGEPCSSAWSRQRAAQVREPRMAPGQLPADAPRGVLEEVADGDAVCHLVLGRLVRDGDLLAVQAPTDDGAVWLPVRYVAHTTHGVDRLPLLHPSWRVAIATVHG